MELEYLSTREAQDLAQQAGLGPVTQSTIRGWAVKYGFGKKVGGRYRITKLYFNRFLKDGNRWDQERAATTPTKTW